MHEWFVRLVRFRLDSRTFSLTSRIPSIRVSTTITCYIVADRVETSEHVLGNFLYPLSISLGTIIGDDSVDRFIFYARAYTLHVMHLSAISISFSPYSDLKVPLPTIDVCSGGVNHANHGCLTEAGCLTGPPVLPIIAVTIFTALSGIEGAYASSLP